MEKVVRCFYKSSEAGRNTNLKTGQPGKSTPHPERPQRLTSPALASLRLFHRVKTKAQKLTLHPPARPDYRPSAGEKVNFLPILQRPLAGRGCRGRGGLGSGSAVTRQSYS
jgi:hypothetical protein